MKDFEKFSVCWILRLLFVRNFAARDVLINLATTETDKGTVPAAEFSVVEIKVLD